MALITYDKEAIVTSLKSRALELASDLCPPPAFRQGNYYFPINPTRPDRHPGSFYIMVGGPKVGGWCEMSGDYTGNILQLIAYIKGFSLPREFSKVLKWANDWLAADHIIPADLPTRTDAPRSPESRRKTALGLWLRGQKSLLGTPAETYLLEHRGLDIRQLKKEPGALRFDPKGRFYIGRDYTEHPMICALMIGGDLKPKAIHRTFLNDSGDGKLDTVSNPKKMLGGFAGGFVPVSRGHSGLPIREATEAGIWDTLAICEGLEDALSVALSCPDWRVVYVGTLGNIGNMPWLDLFEEVFICAQNDENETARNQLASSFLKLKGQARGRKLEMKYPPEGVKDWNDWLRDLMAAEKAVS